MKSEGHEGAHEYVTREDAECLECGGKGFIEVGMERSMPCYSCEGTGRALRGGDACGGVGVEGAKLVQVPGCPTCGEPLVRQEADATGLRQLWHCTTEGCGGTNE
jgi:hypothetical protein